MCPGLNVATQMSGATVSGPKAGLGGFHPCTHFLLLQSSGKASRGGGGGGGLLWGTVGLEEEMMNA